MVLPEVEKARACIKFTKTCYPTSCVFSDILKLVKSPPKKKMWNPLELQLAKTGFCEQRKQECLIQETILLEVYVT